jgi:hypothetical protein
MEKSLRLKSDGLSPSGWPLTRPQRDISTQTRLCRSLTAGRRNRTFLSGMPASGVDPGPTFVSSPADRWVYRGTVIRIAEAAAHAN